MGLTTIKAYPVMLPTEKASNLYFKGDTLRYNPKKINTTNDEFEQYLYLTSNEEIKEGDWCVIFDKLVQYNYQKYRHFPDFDGKKVIATTDELLLGGKCEEGCQGHFHLGNCRTYPLPQIPESFIKQFVEANGEIDEVMVEIKFDEEGWMYSDNRLPKEFESLKTTDNNEVIIHLKEEDDIQNELNKEYGITDEFLNSLDDIHEMIQEERKYEKGKYYDGLGKYHGIIKVYPYNEDYYSLKHKFAEKLPKNTRDCSKINEILIKDIRREQG